MKKHLVLLFTFILFSLIYGEYNIKSSDKEYSIGYEGDGLYRMLTFYKENGSKDFNFVRYRISKIEAKDIYFQDEIKILDRLWMESVGKININLKAISVGYPGQYEDILTVYIDKFLNSKKWRKAKDKKDVKLMRKIIKDEKIYKVLEQFLFVKGYKIKNFTSEKHGFISKKNLQKRGKAGNEEILMPYMLWINLDKID